MKCRVVFQKQKNCEASTPSSLFVFFVFFVVKKTAKLAPASIRVIRVIRSLKLRRQHKLPFS